MRIILILIFLLFTSNIFAFPRYVKSKVRVRGGPGIEYAEIGFLYPGKVEILSKKDIWAETKEGWLLSIFLAEIEPKVVKIAKNYIGVKYRWGGTTSRGFDCSGFVLSVYRKIGVKLPRTASEQFKIGVPVKNLIPGDRVYFQTYKRGASHTGIYIGDGKFIHSSKGGVKISDLSDYKKKYLGAKR